MATPNYYIVDNVDIENQKLQAAQNHYLNGDYYSALKLYSSMLNTSISFKLYYEIGRCYYKLNEFFNAEEYFKRSISLELLKNPSYLYLGNIYYKKDDISRAIEYWSYAYAYKPDDDAVCLNLATSYFSKGMRFQSLFYYEKYLRYAKDKQSNSYISIKNSIDKCKQVGLEFLRKGERAYFGKNYSSAIEFLSFAEQQLPINFDINYLLGSAYLKLNNDMQAMIYLKQALAIDNQSLDTLQKLSSVFINLGDYTSSYCAMRRLLPLVIHNQVEYLKIIHTIKEFEITFDNFSYQGHKRFADNYYENNNYPMALIEYENCIILYKDISDIIKNRVEQLKSFINPEQRIIKTCLEKGGALYSEGNYKTANKYFSKVMLMSNENSSEYKFAKSRVVDV